MDDALSMRSRQSVCYLNTDIKNLVELKRLATQPLFEAYSLPLLHHNEGVPPVVIDGVDGADTWMVELGSSAGLAQKAVQRLLVVEHLRRNELESDVTSQASVFRLVDNAHAPTTELANDVVVGNCLAAPLASHPRKPKSRRRLC